MAQVVAEQRRMLKSSQERQKGFEMTQEQVERLQITVRDLQLKNAALEKEVKQLNENAEMQRTAIIVERKEESNSALQEQQALISLGIQTDSVEEEEKKETSEQAYMLKRASEKQEYLEEKLSKIETENQNLRGEMSILIEDVEYHRSELSKQASIMKRLNTIIGSQKKMIRALKGGGSGSKVVIRNENKLSPRPPLSPVPHISRVQEWNRRRK